MQFRLLAMKQGPFADPLGIFDVLFPLHRPALVTVKVNPNNMDCVLYTLRVEGALPYF
jgi:hypothetical protein